MSQFILLINVVHCLKKIGKQSDFDDTEGKGDTIRCLLKTHYLPTCIF
jgi:hypothetical protein